MALDNVDDDAIVCNFEVCIVSLLLRRRILGSSLIDCEPERSQVWLQSSNDSWVSSLILDV